MRRNTSSARDFARPQSLTEQPLTTFDLFDRAIEAAIPYLVGAISGYVGALVVFTFGWN